MSGRSRSPATALFFEAQLLVVHETPHRPVVDLQPARRALRAPLDRRAPPPTAHTPCSLRGDTAPDVNLPPAGARCPPANLAGRIPAALAQPPHPVDRGAPPPPKLSRRLRAGKAITLNR